jgi:hypothetical protein
MIFSAGNILLPPCNLSYYFLDAFSIKYYKGGTAKSTFEDIVKKDGENNILEDYYGFCVKREIIENRTLVENKIENIVVYEKKPIGILMDSYYLPWNNLQFQMHRTHCFLITDILNDNYICIDTYLSENKVHIDKKTLIDNAGMLFYFSYDEKIKKENGLSDLILYLKSFISIEHKEHIEKIEEFANDILKSKFDTLEHIDYDNIEQSSLIFFIANVEWSRINFSIALKLAKNDFKTSIFDDIISTIDESYIMWGKVKSLMIKNIFIKNYYEKASKLVRTIADKEKKAMEMLLNI